jgi:hypothetical protein
LRTCEICIDNRTRVNGTEKAKNAEGDLHLIFLPGGSVVTSAGNFVQ